MLSSQIIRSANDIHFSSFWECYETSFPMEEKRNLAQQLALFEQKDYQVRLYFDKDQFVGFITTWNFKNLTYIEHFAIQPDLRGKNYGSYILNETIQLTSQKIVLEVELPTDEITKKRIRFYENQGFHLNRVQYIQPAYQPQTHPIPLYTMSYPTCSDQRETDAFVLTYHPIIYPQNSIKI